MKALLLAAVVALPSGSLAHDLARGRDLYELRCFGCHAESVHGRAKRTARTLDEVRSWVARWSTSLSLRWSPDEIEDVTLYLNARYYRYPCPPAACPVVSQAPPGPR